MGQNLPLIESGVLTIGVDASAPLPLHSEFGLPDFKGFEVDLMKAVAARLGFSIRYKSELWSRINHELLAGKLDMICTAATITAERKKTFDFSKPYLNIQLALVVKSGSSICTLEDIQGKVIGVRVATSAEDFIRQYSQSKGIRTFDMNMQVYQLLQQGGVDAVIDDSPIAGFFAASIPGLKLAALIDGTDSQYGVMFNKGNTELRKAVDNALVEIETDGTYAAIYQKWFGMRLFQSIPKNKLNLV